jgi:glycine/serine hydroxymethyltransferase
VTPPHPLNVFFYFLHSISLNKNAVPGDISALSPGGVRLGTSALTSRNFKEKDFLTVAEYLDQAVKIALSVQVSRLGRKHTTIIYRYIHMMDVIF